MTEPAERYRVFWRSFIGEIQRIRPVLGSQLSPRQKAGIRLASSPRIGATYRLWWSGGSRTKQLRVEFFIRGNRDLYRSLAEHRFDVEGAFGGPLAWEAEVGKKDSRIAAYHGSTYGLNELPTAEALCPWIVATLDRLKDAIDPILLGQPLPSSLSGDEAGVQVFKGHAMPEGAITHAEVLRYERSRSARAACLRHFGYRCQVCDLDFEERYGELGRGFMHVHHIVGPSRFCGMTVG